MGKRALLVGCNYPKTQFQLHGCINDVLAMRDVLVRRFDFDPSLVELLTDGPLQGSSGLPTGVNIKAALNKMVNSSQAGDVLFFHFSGHGTKIPSLEPGQPFRQDEAIVPCDLNIITDEDFRELVNRLPKGVGLTILSDSCHSGGLIDKEKLQIGPATLPSRKRDYDGDTGISVHHRTRGISIQAVHQCLESASTIFQGVGTVAVAASGLVTGVDSLLSGIFRRDVSIKFRPQRGRVLSQPLHEDLGILLSGCQANETSADVVANPNTGGLPHGAFTNAVLQVLNETLSELSNEQLVLEARKVLVEHQIEQHPCLYCSDMNAGAAFLGRPNIDM